jgi:hypothetical protein
MARKVRIEYAGAAYPVMARGNQGRDIDSDVLSPDGEAKFWLEPAVELALSKGLKATELTELKRVVEERQNEIRDHWQRHFGG